MFLKEDKAFAALKATVLQLETLKTHATFLYDELVAEHQKLKEFKEPANAVTLAGLSLTNQPFKAKLDATLAKLPPETITLHRLRRFQAELKTNIPRTQLAYDLAGTLDPLTQLHKSIATKNNNVLTAIRDDAKVIHEVFTPSIQLHYDAKGFQEKPYDSKSFIADPPDAILIMGNNDLIQIDHIADLVNQLPPGQQPTLYVSGFGGHGTVQGKIFSFSEGDTIKRHLLERGIPEEKLRLETDAIDTGMNVKKIEVMILIEHLLHKVDLSLRDANYLRQMKHRLQQRIITAAEICLLEKFLEPHRERYVKNKTMLHKHILISHSHAALLRGIRTFEKQAIFHYGKISCIAPPKLVNHYYGNTQDAKLNFMLALREIASFLDYTVNSTYLSDRRLLNENNLIACIILFVKHYNQLTSSKVNATKLHQQFITFSALKAESPELAMKDITLINALNSVIKPMATYFRTAFTHVEAKWMQQLRSIFSLRQQSERLDISGAYQCLGLIPATVKHPKSNDTTKVPTTTSSLKRATF